MRNTSLKVIACEFRIKLLIVSKGLGKLLSLIQIASQFTLDNHKRQWKRVMQYRELVGVRHVYYKF